MIKTFFCLFFSICIVFFSLPFLYANATSAEPDIYSSLPEPLIVDDSKAYFAVNFLFYDQNSSTFNNVYCLVMVQCLNGIKDVMLSYNDDDNLVLDVVTESSAFLPAFTFYDLLTGEVYLSTTIIDNQILNALYQFTFDNSVFGYAQKVNPLSCLTNEGWNLPTLNIAWSDNTDPQVYINWLSSIEDRLDHISSNTDYMDAHLIEIYEELDLFSTVFSAYSSKMGSDMDIVKDKLQSFNDKMDAFSIQNHEDLIQIYNKLDEIYNLLNEEASTYATPEQESQIDSYIQAEADLNKDYSGDLQNQFGTAQNIFEGNNAFSFISVCFQRLVIGNSKINGLLIFALAVGLCVLVLGRRLNA